MSGIKSNSKDLIVFNSIAYSLVGLFALFCIIPLLLVFMGSISSEQSILESGYSLIPREIDIQAYKVIFKNPGAIISAYGVTVFITVVGTAVGLFLTAMTAYVLQKKDFRYRNFFAFYFYFTTLFNGGLVPWYILMVRYLGMKNNIMALIIPNLFNIFYLIVIRTFISTIPYSIIESVKIDGAGDFKIFVNFILPLSKPALASMGLFMALNFWNDWFSAMLFIDNERLIPLQYYLYKMLSQIEVLRRMVNKLNKIGMLQTPTESVKMAMTIITIGPIILLYPYLQKFFIKGIMIGALKG